MIPTCKYDKNQSYLTKCFPVRTILQWRKEDSDHWLDSFRKATEQTHRHAHGRMKESSREDEDDAAAPSGRTLDASLLLRLRSTDRPAHLSSVDISEQNLNSVNPDDLRLFENLLYVDASANSLSLDSFSPLVSLRELNLTLNGLCDMTFNADDFPHLQVLDLSYNTLSADGITCIGGIPRLKVLHLTGNQLRRLPPHLGFPHDGVSPQSTDEENTSFRALEVLLLDDNKLSSQVFHSVKNLKRLKHLNLQGNRISKVPDFPPPGCSTLLQTDVGRQEEEEEEDRVASTEFETVEAKTLLQQHWQEYRKRSWVPLPNLQYLCLADNKIAEEEALMAVALFPRIREIDISSNPLTVQKSGDPPLLTHHLQDVLGINIKRKKTQLAVQRTVRASPHSRSKDDGAKGQSLKGAQKVAPSQPHGTKLTSSEGTVQGNTELFFLTQAATDAPENQSSLQTAAKNEETHRDEDVPVKPADYAALMDVKSESDRTAPVGIQTAVWRLEQALRESRPRVDATQQQREVRRRPVVTAARQVDEIMEAVRQSTTTTRDVLLSSAMQGSDRQEALLLLKDLKAKCETLDQNTMGYLV